MPETQTTLTTIYKGWEDYQGHLIKAIAPLTPDQLELRAAPHLRSIGELAVHMVRTRASWFHRAIGEGSDETAPLLQWQDSDAPARTAAELVSGLEATWRLIQSSLARWTPDDLAQPFQRERSGQEYTLTRQWIIWHLIEHDLHHGGEISYSLGMHGLQAPDI
jgi:uncharacterized damage-inducible protein DinB